MPEANSTPILSNLLSRKALLAPEPAQRPKLLNRLREALGSWHYSRRTQQIYCHWVKRFIFFHHLRHPAEMSEHEIKAFFTPLAVNRHFFPPHLLEKGKKELASYADKAPAKGSYNETIGRKGRLPPGDLGVRPSILTSHNIIVTMYI